MTDSQTITRHLRLYGQVQGVYFRESMCQKAAQWQLTGWVRNRSDGSVEALIQGSTENVSLMLEWARRGPERARVDRIDIADGSGSYTTFERHATT